MKTGAFSDPFKSLLTLKTMLIQFMIFLHFSGFQILLDTYILTDINKTSRAVPDVLINSSQLHVSLYILVSFLVMTVVIG